MICLKARMQSDSGRRFYLLVMFYTVELNHDADLYSHTILLLSKLMPNGKLQHVGISLAVEDNSEDNQPRKTTVFPFDYSAWAGRKSGITLMCSKHDESMSSTSNSDFMTVSGGKILQLPISADLAQTIQETLVQQSEHATEPQPCQGKNKLFSYIGMQYPHFQNIVRDGMSSWVHFPQWIWRASRDEQILPEFVQDMQKLFMQTHAQCSQISALFVLNVMCTILSNNEQREFDGSHIHNLRALLQNYQTSLHPGKLYQAMKDMKNGQANHIFREIDDASLRDMLIEVNSVRVNAVSDFLLPFPYNAASGVNRPFL